jgi:hypothetical protein
MGGYDRTLVVVGRHSFSHAFAYNILQGGVLSAVIIATLVMASPDIGSKTQDNSDLHRALLRLGIFFLCLAYSLASTLFMALVQQWGHLMLMVAADTPYCIHSLPEVEKHVS